MYANSKDMKKIRATVVALLRNEKIPSGEFGVLIVYILHFYIVFVHSIVPKRTVGALLDENSAALVKNVAADWDLLSATSDTGGDARALSTEALKVFSDAQVGLGCCARRERREFSLSLRNSTTASWWGSVAALHELDDDRGKDTYYCALTHLLLSSLVPATPNALLVNLCVNSCDAPRRALTTHLFRMICLMAPPTLRLFLKCDTMMPRCTPFICPPTLTPS